MGPGAQRRKSTQRVAPKGVSKANQTKSQVIKLRDEVYLASRSRKGHWRMSCNTLLHRAMTDNWLSEQGLPNLTEQWVAIRYPEQPKGSKGQA